MSDTIFVDHQPGTYKVYKTVGGWSLMFLDVQGNSRPVDGDKVYPSRQNAYRRCKQLNQNILMKVLENYLKSDDFKAGVIASTRASWNGSGYSVELLYDGTWANIWNNSIGNLYDSPGVLLRIPTFTDDGTYEEAVNGVGLPEGQEPMSEEDYFDLCFANEAENLANELREALSE